jgi:copper(I)-binding protein
VNRFKTAVLVATGLIAAAALTGCSSGQIAQTSEEQSAVNGAQADVKYVALRNVHISAAQTGDFLRPGQTVELVFVATNQSPDVSDKLVGITTDIGTVTVTGDTRLPAGGKLLVGTPDGKAIKALDAVEPANAAKATVALAKPVSSGLTYKFTFDFEKAGTVDVTVPIAAGSAPSQEKPPVPAQNP